ncbi:MAG: transporter substrate-binding domain-containing protein [Azospirillaceae bacterium]|nr:transporter substrate-binding domain-containing protein [Azospirillaceae bacterium]
MGTAAQAEEAAAGWGWVTIRAKVEDGGRWHVRAVGRRRALGLLAGGVLAGGASAAAPAPIRLAGNPAWYPYSWEEGDQLHGLGMDRATAALTRLGLPYVLQTYGLWQRALAALSHGQVDLLISSVWNPARTERLLYTEPYARDDVRAFVRIDDVGLYHGVADLLGRGRPAPLGVAPLGSAYGPDMDALEARGLRLERSGTTEGMLQRVRYGRADFCVLVHQNGRHLLRTLGLTSVLAPLPFPLAPLQVRMLMRRDGPLVGRINAFNTLIATA